MSDHTNERLDRYADAVVGNLGLTKDETEPMHIEVAHAVMAVADAEQAELRAEVERLQKDRDTAQEHVAYHLRDYSLNGEATGDLAVDMAAHSGRLRIRAEAAEAERDRARSLAATLEARLVEAEALHVPCSEHPTCADDDNFCHECGQDSPCTTARFLHPEESA